MSRPPTVVYIAGRGYSGSTLLDLLIGSHSGAVSLGELRALSERTRAKGKRFDQERCTCGAPTLYDCPFWSHIDRRIRTTVDHDLGTIDVYDPDHNRAILSAIGERSGADLVVDSSKQPARLQQLLEDDRLDVRPVHLIRGPLGEVYSHIKRGEDLRHKIRMYNRDTVEIHRMLEGRDHRVVRYEHLARRPREVVAGLMEWLGMAPEADQLAWTTHEHHNISGNPMRFSGSSEIRVDESWRKGLGLRQKLTIALMTVPARQPGTSLYRYWPERWK